MAGVLNGRRIAVHRADQLVATVSADDARDRRLISWPTVRTDLEDVGAEVVLGAVRTSR
jgi:hypothetical protein